MRFSCARIVGTAIAMLWSTFAFAGDPAAAREQLKIGYLLSQEGKCAEAVPHLEESLRLEVKAITLINLANCEEKIGKLAEAAGHWADARARAQIEDAQPIADEAEKRANALEPRLPKLTIVLTTPAKGATVIRDAIALGPASLGMALPVNPGEHVIVVRAPGHADSTTNVTIAEAEQKQIEVAVGPEGESAKPSETPNPRTTSSLVYVGFGGAALFAAAGTVTGLMALGAASNADRDCPNLVCKDQAALDSVESGRTLGTVSTIAFIAVPVFAAIGVYGLVWGGKKKDTSVGVSLGVIRGMF